MESMARCPPYRKPVGIPRKRERPGIQPALEPKRCCRDPGPASEKSRSGRSGSQISGRLVKRIDRHGQTSSHRMFAMSPTEIITDHTNSILRLASPFFLRSPATRVHHGHRQTHAGGVRHVMGYDGMATAGGQSPATDYGSLLWNCRSAGFLDPGCHAFACHAAQVSHPQNQPARKSWRIRRTRDDGLLCPSLQSTSLHSSHPGAVSDSRTCEAETVKPRS